MTPYERKSFTQYTIGVILAGFVVLLVLRFVVVYSGNVDKTVEMFGQELQRNKMIEQLPSRMKCVTKQYPNGVIEEICY